VGLCAAVREGRALLLWPLSFVAAMAGGFWLAETGMALPAHETLIALSVLGLGLVLLAGLALPILPGALVMGAFALAHGYAHGLEATSTDSLPYVAGFGLASLLLHLAGMALVLVAARFSWRLAARQAGAAIAPVGALLVLA
jgi:urease accessory protein